MELGVEPVGLTPPRGEADPAAGPARLAGLIAGSGSTLVLTGAGVSVPSGIADFRSPGEGIWEDVDPFEVASIEAFNGDARRFWSFYRQRFDTLLQKRPNPAHEALAELERRGLIEAVVTQNIDRLHRAAGTRELIEVHGSIATSTCTDCRVEYPPEQVAGLFEEGIALCESCGGRVKPDVVLFGEMLPVAAINRARELAETAELIIAIGSSLEVYPAAGLPELTLAGGGKLALVTIGPTPYDEVAELKLGGDVATELPAVLEALDR